MDIIQVITMTGVLFLSNSNMKTVDISLCVFSFVNIFTYALFIKYLHVPYKDMNENLPLAYILPC
jgi:hypothetical protein